MKKSERGSVTVEASISLVAFIFAMVTVFVMVNVCIAQSRVGMAVNSTAKELSQYSYLYSLTGLQKTQADVAENAKASEEKARGMVDKVNTVFTEIQNIGNTATRMESQSFNDKFTELRTSATNIKENGAKLKDSLSEIGKDPKGAAMALASIAISDSMDYAMSKLIAEPLARAMCQKNLVSKRDGSTETFLKGLGVVPAANGSYYDGIDFSNSLIFPEGSNEIRITAVYDIKIVPLLPIDLRFHFCQTAITQGWLGGSLTYKTVEDQLQVKGNDTIWTSGDTHGRSELIRNQALKDLEDNGFHKIAGGSFQDIQAYDPDSNEFAMVRSMNPLYSAEGERTMTLDDINDDVLREQIEIYCAGTAGTVSSLDKIKVKNPPANAPKDGYDCSGATAKVVLVIPEDEGLEDKIKKIAAGADTKGVTVEIVKRYGNGARTTEAPADDGQKGEGDE